MYVGQQGHPKCGFFEAFASSADPDCDFFGEFFCHMVSEQTPALVCKGDYLLCPLAYGKSRLTQRAPDAEEVAASKGSLQASSESTSQTDVTQPQRG